MASWVASHVAKMLSCGAAWLMRRSRRAVGAGSAILEASITMSPSPRTAEHPAGSAALVRARFLVGSPPRASPLPEYGGLTQEGACVWLCAFGDWADPVMSRSRGSG